MTGNSAATYHFENPLSEGIVVARPNRFIMDVKLHDEEIRCHCPVVSRIGPIETAGRPCLISESSNPKRKFKYTVEALSLDGSEDVPKSWFGINQTASNKYVEYFLAHNAFYDMVGPVYDVKREVPLGHSRLDFLVNNDVFIEVKTPLVQLQMPIPEHIQLLPEKPFSSTDRALKHWRELADSLQNHERAIILYCFYYPNPGFRFYHGTTYQEVHDTVTACQEKGVELWQANFSVSPHEVSLQSYFPLQLQWDE